MRNTHYDQAGRVVRQTPAGKVGFTVSRYDALGRTTVQFLAHGGTLDLSDPGNISDATVVAQTQLSYDDAGNQIAGATRQRFDDAAGTAELRDPATEPKARVSYTASYPDTVGRTQAIADYGTGGGAAWSRSATVPAASDAVLVTVYTYDDAGNQVESTNPAGTVTRQEFDRAGRRVAVIENYVSEAPPDPAVNKTTAFAYNLDGNLVTLTAANPATGPQVTEWIYGVTTGQGSALDSKGLLYQKIYPGAAAPVSYRYNRQSQPVEMTDQGGTTHAYSYDRFGRPLSDAATAFGAGIDTVVQALTRTYEVRGMIETVTSLGAAGGTLNKVQLAYNAYSQLTKDYQAHSGAVDTGTTLNVGYLYADGSDNTVRPTGITYPDGTTVIGIAYEGTAADALSRPDALKEGTATLCTYRYLGGGIVIGVKYDAASNVELTYEDGGTSTTGDKYTGLDRFGRLVETLWKQGSAKPVNSKYGRNRFGGVVWRRDEQAHMQTPSVITEDNYYTYDGLYQVKQRQRGALTGNGPEYTGITNLQQEEAWTYDATGNWAVYDNTSPTNAQTRTHNTANEITQIASSPGDIDPTYDAAGNMLTLPKEPGISTDQYDLVWDAWSRLVAVKDGSTVVASYTYDGLSRRLTKTNATETRHYYYNSEWRGVEERPGNQTTVDRQYTWGLRDRWDLFRRKRSVSGLLDEALYVLRDYLDPVAIADDSGTVVERYAYDAFGNVRFLNDDYTEKTTGSAFDWDFLFHGEFRDRDIKLYNYGFRYYDTNLGRWLSRDLIGERGGWNLNVFVRNAPVVKWDKLGLQCGPAGFAFKGDNRGESNTFWHMAGGAGDPPAGGGSGNFRQGDSGSDMFNFLESLTQNCCCISDLRLAAHATPGGGLGSSQTGPHGFYSADVNEDSPVKDDARGMNQIRAAMQSGKIQFCPNCVIKLHTCDMGGNARLIQRLASATGCRVIGTVGGLCSPTSGRGDGPNTPWSTDGKWQQSNGGDSLTPLPPGGPVFDPVQP